MLRRALFQIAWHLHRFAYRISGGRVGSAGTLELRTVGRRTGEPRMTLLNYLADADRYVVVASNAGASKDPAWFLNLAARPEAMVTVGGRRIPVRARAANGQEHDTLWHRIVIWNPSYRSYQQRTARRIPVVVLEPRTDAA